MACLTNLYWIFCLTYYVFVSNLLIYIGTQRIVTPNKCMCMVFFSLYLSNWIHTSSEYNPRYCVSPRRSEEQYPGGYGQFSAQVE